MNYAIIVAAGQGKRMNNKVNKIFLSLNDKPVIYHSVKPFEDCVSIDKIIVVVSKDDVIGISEVIKNNGLKKVLQISEGG
ncbi:MAG: 2-C-methyl-D-erythritol 4-phosphate cytidylyltransferase, partial [Nanoarchaeota archaeon]|nr:2-C-methyl-D-erythritol 4-phosphate cytidylyltransferase [Nanoarchaeota archaeon]